MPKNSNKDKQGQGSGAARTVRRKKSDGRERTGVHPEELHARRKALRRCRGPGTPGSSPSFRRNCM